MSDYQLVTANERHQATSFTTEAAATLSILIWRLAKVNIRKVDECFGLFAEFSRLKSRRRRWAHHFACDRAVVLEKLKAAGNRLKRQRKTDTVQRAGAATSCGKRTKEWRRRIRNAASRQKPTSFADCTISRASITGDRSHPCSVETRGRTSPL